MTDPLNLLYGVLNWATVVHTVVHTAVSMKFNTHNKNISTYTYNYMYSFTYIFLYTEGRVSSVGIATRYGLDGPGSNPGGGEIFHSLPARCRDPPSLLYSG
jgi:hypothetical protein